MAKKEKEITPELEPLVEEAKKYGKWTEFRSAVSKDPELLKLLGKARRKGFTAQSFWEAAQKYYGEEYPGDMLQREEELQDTVRVELVRLRPAPQVKIRKATDVVDMVKVMEDYDREWVKVLHLTVQNMVVGVETISIGSLTQAVVNPREAMKGAILMNAARVVYVHNHPSGVCKPSKEDQDITERLKETFDLVGIHLLDSIIIARNCYYSFLEEHATEYETAPPESPKTYEELGILEYAEPGMVREAGSNLNRTIEIDWKRYREQLRGIQQMVYRHATSAKIDGDRDVITINEPNDILMEELESRGIEYREV